MFCWYNFHIVSIIYNSIQNVKFRLWTLFRYFENDERVPVQRMRSEMLVFCVEEACVRLVGVDSAVQADGGAADETHFENK